MQTIILAEVLKTRSAITPKTGGYVYDMVNNFINNNEPVQIKLEGIRDVNSAFFNAFVGKLYLTYGSDKIDNLLIFPDIESNRIWKVKLESAKQLGTNEVFRKMRQESLNDLSD